ncbi:hypothetical protein [Bradyrhizobium sp. SZCCHNRI3042]|uniref:hypothetical protein n=1 Tax=Bradyrhizobium sp. SZCCHNRI3042 TaxID=3057291 RepID=UPI0029165005|nr:hypothetical protein [Bradyrhizobium sp. SZCCHNRI3042]
MFDLILDWFLLWAASIRVFKQLFNGHLTEQGAEALLTLAIVWIAIKRLAGLTKRVRVLQTVFSALLFAWEFSRGDVEAAKFAFIVTVCGAIAMFPAYYMITAGVRAALGRKNDSEPWKLPDVGTIIFVVIFILACLQVLPEWLANTQLRR